MSLYSAMLAGVAGLQSNSTALAAISENIANVNTVGYKTDQTDFETLVTTTAGSETYSAGGVATVNRQLVNQQGSTTQTSSPTDLAIAGQGMFVVNSTPAAPGTSGQMLFTRAGSFTTDNAGNLVNTAGYYLMGWPADANGKISTSSSASSLQPINIDALSGAVSPTTAVAINGNVNADQAISAAATAAGATPAGTGAYNATSNSMTAYNASSGTGVQPDFTMQIPVSDSKGGQHTLQIDLLRSTTPNQWYAEIQSVPTSDVASASGKPAGQIATGIVAFNPDGTINTANTTLPTSISLGASGGTAPAWATSLGVAAQTVGVNVAGSSGIGGLTQYASASAVTQTTTNGTPFGSLSSVAVDKNGLVSATFSNGTTRVIAQVAMATFPNEDGLTSVNGNAYQASQASGNYNLTTAGAGGSGTIASSALEASTVDLSKEFSDLITTQSAYSAASKVIATADTMTQALMQVIQG